MSVLARVKCSVKSLADGLDTEEVVPSMIEAGVISFDDSELIFHEATRLRRAMKLLELVVAGGDSACKALLQALADQSSYLVEIVQNADLSKLHEDPTDKHIASNDLRAIIQEELSRHYLAQLNTLSPVPWLPWFNVNLEKVYTALHMIRSISRHAFRDSNTQRQDRLWSAGDLFRPSDCSADPRRILVEGEPGIGKTTMCCKLAYDWAKGSHGQDQSQDESVQRFSLVFLLRARHLDPGKTLIQTAYEQLLSDDLGVSLDEFRKCVLNNQPETLFIVDGFDEILAPHGDLQKVISGRTLNQATLLVTARPGAILSLLGKFNSVFVNIGYDPERRAEFVLKFSAEISGEPCQHIFQQLISQLKSDSLLKELCRNPLNLSILCMLIAERQAVLPSSKTMLYQELQNFILRRTSTTLMMELEAVQELTKPLAKLAFQALRNNCSNIDQSELDQVGTSSLVESLGILRKEISVSKFTQKATFSFTHKSFQEFYAAQHIMKTRLRRRERKAMATELLHLTGNRIALVFLCGLLAQSESQADEDTLLDVFELLKQDTFLPCVPCEELGAYDAAENHRGHLLFHCLNELSHVPSVVGLSLVFSSVEQVCFSYPWCTNYCIEGFLKFSGMFDMYCMACSRLRPSLAAVQKRYRKSLDALDFDLDSLAEPAPSEPRCTKFSFTIPAQLVSERLSSVEMLLSKATQDQHITAFGLHAITGLYQVQSVFKILSSLKRLRFNNLVLKFLSVEDSHASLSHSEFFQWLQGFEILDCNHAGALNSLLTAIPAATSLRSVSVVNCTFDDDSFNIFLQLLSRTKALKVFKFTNNNMQVHSPLALVELLEHLSHMNLLQELTISHLPCPSPGGDTAVFTHPFLAHLCSNNKLLTNLHLNNSELNEELLTTLATSFDPHGCLRCVELSYNLVPQPQALAELIWGFGDLYSLRELIMVGTELSYDCHVALKGLLEVTRGLKILTVTTGSFGNLQEIAEGLQKNTTLQSLWLHGFSADETTMDMFAAALRVHPHLQQLKIRGHRSLVCAKLSTLFNALAACCSLTAVELARCDLQDFHMIEFSRLLKAKDKIQEVGLKGNLLGASGINHLCKALCQRETKLRRLDLSDNTVTDRDPEVQLLKTRVLYLRVNWF